MGLFDAIMITAATPAVGDHFLSMLKLGGKLLAPIGARESQMLTLLTKNQKGITTQTLGACVFVPLMGKYGFN